MDTSDLAFESIDGKTLRLRDWRGKAVLVVNTASECGYTPQYKGLQSLWTRYRDRGLVVVGVPSNDFGGQEPGTETQIQTFCTKTYAVDFPMTRKETIIGADAHPFYRTIASELGEDAAPRWNFHKYLLDRDGALAGAWPSRVEPDNPELVKAIEAVLSH